MYSGGTALDFYHLNGAAAAYIVARFINIRIGVISNWTAEPSAYMIFSSTSFEIRSNSTPASGSLLIAANGMSSNSTVTPSVTIAANSNSVGSTGFGSAIVLQARTSTTVSTQLARLVFVWNDATHASRKGDLVAYASDAAAERELWRGRADGSAAAIGFLGAAPVPQAAHIADPSGGGTVDSEARTAINAVLTVLENLGFVATS